MLPIVSSAQIAFIRCDRAFEKLWNAAFISMSWEEGLPSILISSITYPTIFSGQMKKPNPTIIVGQSSMCERKLLPKGLNQGEGRMAKSGSSANEPEMTDQGRGRHTEGCEDTDRPCEGARPSAG